MSALALTDWQRFLLICFYADVATDLFEDAPPAEQERILDDFVSIMLRDPVVSAALSE
jgi:hypothetical protein